MVTYVHGKVHGKFFGYICACLDLKKVTYVTWKKIYREVHNSFQKILSIKNNVRVDLGCKFPKDTIVEIYGDFEWVWSRCEVYFM